MTRFAAFRRRVGVASRWRPPPLSHRLVAVTAILVFFFAGAALVRHQADSHVNRMDPDESHTLLMGTPAVDNAAAAWRTVRVGETTRWFVRALYPLGVYYMNTRMGNDWERDFGGVPGEAERETTPANEWYWPGGYYLDKNFGLRTVRSDPNVQDYVFAMRFAFGIMAIFSFSWVMWELYRRFDVLSCIVYGASILGGSVVFDRFSIFYSETSLFILFNLAMILFLRFNRPTYRESAFFGFLAAAALSIKLSGALAAAPALAHAAVRGTGNLRVFVLCVYFIAFMVFINFWTEKSYFHFVNETLVNVWNYGGRRMTEHDWTETALRILAEIGVPFTVLFVAAFLYLILLRRGKLLSIYVLGAFVLVFAWSLSNATVYLTRNAAPLYVAMSFIVALAAGDAAKRLARGGGVLRYRGAAGLCVLPVVAALQAPPSVEDMFFKKNTEKIQRCEDVAVLGLPRKRAVAATSRNDAATFEIFAGPFVSSEDARWFEKYMNHDCVIVKREGQNKHISNYFAPLTHDMVDRKGDIFFYKRKISNVGH